MYKLLALLPLTELTNPGGARDGECKQSQDSYVKLISGGSRISKREVPLQHRCIARASLAWPDLFSAGRPSAKKRSGHARLSQGLPDSCAQQFTSHTL